MYCGEGPTDAGSLPFSSRAREKGDGEPAPRARPVLPGRSWHSLNAWIDVSNAWLDVGLVAGLVLLAALCILALALL